MTKTKKTLADLAAVHDRKIVVPNRINQAIAALQATGDDWAYEQDFLALVKPPIANIDISKYREQFADFWAEMPTTNGKSSLRRVWFATKAAAKKWKETVGG